MMSSAAMSTVMVPSEWVTSVAVAEPHPAQPDR